MARRTTTAVSKSPATPELDLTELDLGALALLVGQAINAEVQEGLATKGFGDVRNSHASLIQHLVGGGRTVGDLAQRLGVSQQAASKSVAELGALGYVSRSGAAEGGDRRVTRVELTARGKSVVQASRKIRQAITKKLEDGQGVKATAQARTALTAALGTLGGAAAARTRRTR